MARWYDVNFNVPSGWVTVRQSGNTRRSAVSYARQFGLRDLGIDPKVASVHSVVFVPDPSVGAPARPRRRARGTF